MHSLAFALVPTSEAVSSEEAKEKAHDILVNDGSFIEAVDYSYRYGSPICDYFSIGGRFSGCLYPKEMRDQFYKKAKSLAGVGSEFFDRSQLSKHENELDAIWRDLGGQGNSPLNRNTEHSEDDAQILTKPLIPSIRDREIFDCSEDMEYGSEPDLDELVGKVWVVVIDYHH